MSAVIVGHYVAQNGKTQALANDGHVINSRADGNQPEFFAAYASKEAIVARTVTHDSSDLLQHFVSHCMSMGIVDRLEVIEIDQGKPERSLVGKFELLFQHAEKGPAIG